MAQPSVTFTFTNGTTADATQVNTNFTDLINSLTDGTKDLTIAAITLSGTATLNGNTVVGNNSADTVTINATLASDLLPTDATYDLGSTTKNFVEAHLNNGATDGGAIYFDGGTTSFIKSSADGTSCGFGAFKNFIQAFAYFNGTGSVAIISSHNVTSITDNGTGDYTVNITTAFSDANFLALCSANSAESSLSSSQSSTTVNVTTRNSAGSASDAAAVRVLCVGAR